MEGFRNPLALVGHDRLEVAVGDLALAVGQLLEAHEGPLEVLVVEAVAEGRETLTESVAPAQLAEHQAGAGPDLLRLHDLEGPAVLEHAVLVDAGLMGKGIAAHHRLVGLDEHAAQLGDEPGGAEELGVVEAGGHPEDLGVKPDRHRHLLEGGVAGALADPVDAALHLAGAGTDADEGVGGGEAQVVVAVHGDGHVLQGRDLHVEPLDELTPLVGSGVADRVGEVDGRRPRLDAAVQHMGQVVRLRARRVHGGVLDVFLEGFGQPRHAHRALVDLGLGHPQLPFAVDGRGADEDVDAGTLRLGERLGTGADVLLEAAAEAGDDRPLDLLGDGRDGGEIAGGAVGEAGLDDVDAEPCQLVGDGQLVLGAEGHARRLLAVAQRGVQDGERLQLLRSPLHEERIAQAD